MSKDCPESATPSRSASAEMQEALSIIERLASVVSSTPKAAYKDWACGADAPYAIVREAQSFIAQPRFVQSEIGERTLTKPALVGNTRFGIGVKERLVVERAQREYEYQVTPEKEAERVERIGEFHAACSGVSLCPKCGVNLLEAPCPNGHMAETMGQCPMVGLSDQVNAAHEKALAKGRTNK